MLANVNLINCLLIIAGLIICYLFLLIPVLIYYAVQHMRSPPLVSLPETEWDDYLTGKCRVESEWAETNQFELNGIYRLQQSYILVWQNEDLAAYFQSTLSPYGRFHSFTTLFKEDYSLVTANDRESLVFPSPPRRFVQSFGIEKIDDLNEKHQASVVDLIRVKQLDSPDNLPGFEETYLGSVQRQREYVRSYPLYPILGIWWYHVGRRRKFNQPIDLQATLGD